MVFVNPGDSGSDSKFRGIAQFLMGKNVVQGEYDSNISKHFKKWFLEDLVPVVRHAQGLSIFPESVWYENAAVEASSLGHVNEITEVIVASLRVALTIDLLQQSC